MRKLLVLAAVAFCAPIAGARVWTVAYRCDGVTPLPAVDPNFPTIYSDIMVGTRLILVVRSDAPGLSPDRLLWSGRLLISQDERPRGTLSGRGYSGTWRSYEGSCLPAGGFPPFATAKYRESDTDAGFNLGVSFTSVAGDWFVFDYRAEQAGSCHVVLYENDPVVGATVPTQVLSFAHVPSRDFNGDTVVDSRDFSLLAAHWGSTARPDPNDPAAAFDLDGDGTVALGDIASFSEYWLQRTDCLPPAEDPNGPAPGL
jgi:hypothetical protein